MQSKMRVCLSRFRLCFYLLGGLLMISGTACRSIGFVDSASPEPELESTLAAMRATLELLEARQLQPTPTPSPQIVVVTATPTETPLPNPTPTLTPTPLPTPPPPTATDTPAPAPQARTIVIVVTPTRPATLTPHPDAPVNTGPRDGAVVEQGQEIILHWSWNGLLGPGEYFEVKLRPDAQSRSAYIAQELGEAHDFKAIVGPGRYQWTVQVVKGHFINNSGHPDDWLFEAFRSPESEANLIIVADDDDDDNRDNDDDDGDDDDDDDGDDDDDDGNPLSMSQADPPEPTIPYSLFAGGLAFIVTLQANHNSILSRPKRSEGRSEGCGLT